MAIKLIATDMDGTLLGADHVTIPARNIAALRAASERGVKIAIASGRTWKFVEDTAEALGCLDYAILSNGAAVQEAKSGKRLYENCIPNAQAAELVRFLRRRGFSYEVYCEGKNYVEEDAMDRESFELFSPDFKEVYFAKSLFVPDMIEALAGRDVEKFDILRIPGVDQVQLLAELRTIAPVTSAAAIVESMEFTLSSANKGRALQGLAAKLGLRQEEVMALGDAENDLEMLTWAGCSVAMENGSEAVKAAAKHVTGSNCEAGLADAVEKYVLEA